MSESTPADLANAFRSFARRAAEARRSAAGSSVTSLSNELDQHIRSAAAALGVDGDAEAVAAAIDAKEPEDWDDATLDRVRAAASGAGTTLRSITEAADAELGESGDEGSSGSW